MAYLALFGSILGWLVLSEPVTNRTFLSMAIVMAAVVVVRCAGRKVAVTPQLDARVAEPPGDGTRVRLQAQTTEAGQR